MWFYITCCCCSVTQLCLTLCEPMDCSMPGFPVLHYLPELLKFMSIELVMLSIHLFCCSLLLLHSIFPSIRVFLMSQLFTSGGQSIGASLFFFGTLHSFGYIFPFLPCFLLIFFPQLLVKSPETTTLLSCCSFPLGWFSSLPFVQCYEPLFIVIQALYLLDIISWIYSSLPLYNHMGFDLGHNWMALVVFPFFL